MPALEAIGRTNTLRAVTGDLQKFAQDQRNQGLREREFALKEQAVKSNLADVEFKRQQAQEQAKIANKPIPVEMISNAFPVPEVAQYAQKFASALGYVEDINGVPTIRAGKAKEIYGLLHQGDHPQVISGITVNHYRSQVSQIKTQLAELQQSGKDLSKDKNAAALTQALKQAQMGLVSSLENADRLDTYSGYVKQGYAPENVQKAMETGDMSLLGEPAQESSKVPSALRSFEMAHYGGTLSTDERSSLVGSGQYEKDYKQFQLDTKTSSYDIPQEGIDNMVDAVASGQEATANIPKRGKTFSAVESGVLEKYPKFNFTMNNANSKYRSDSNILRSAGLVNAALPRVYSLLDKAKELENTFGVPALDKPLNALKREAGSEKVVDFESLRNAMLFEVNTALSGSSVPSDYRIKIELENMKSGLTLGQQIASISNLVSALQARKDASTMNAYPMSVVRGEETLDQWRKREERESQSTLNSYKNNSKESGGGRVKVVSPDGQVGSIPESQLEEALSNGYRRQ